MIEDCASRAGLRERLLVMNPRTGRNTTATQVSLGRRSRGYYAGLWIMGISYIVAGINHFTHTTFYLTVMPPYLPSPLLLIYTSGIAEILGGVGVLIPNGFVFPRTRVAAAWGIVALLIAVSTVHINMCLHAEKFPAIPLWVIWFRMPLQLLLIGWAWMYTRQ
jgi:uncharacterized membrane protein